MILARMEQTASTAPLWHQAAALASRQSPAMRTGSCLVIRWPAARTLTGAPMNAGNGTPCDYPISGGTGTCGSSTNQLGRIDIAVAPSNPNYIYAQAQSIVWNNNGGCGNTNGCQLGAWASTDGGTSWTYMEGSQGGALRNCRIRPAIIRRTGTIRASLSIQTTPTACSSIRSTCGLQRAREQSGTIRPAAIPAASAAGPVHVDQHALAFVPGSSSILAIGNDGGVHGTTNADVVNADNGSDLV